LAIFFALLAVLASSSVKAQPASRTKPLVIASIAPHAYFAKRIGGPAIEVMTLLPPGSSPHSFEPTPRQIALAAEATAYFQSGVEAENTVLPKLEALNRRLVIFDVNEGIELRHADDSKHAGKSDPHVWLSPRLAKTEARNIYLGLTKIDPKHVTLYEQNLNALLTELEMLDREITKTFHPLAGRTIYVFHPAFGYFAQSYGLKEVAIAHEGKEPGAAQLAALIDMARRDGVKSIFVEPQFSSKTADVIAHSVGASVVSIDPLAEDYMTNMKKIADLIAQALKDRENTL
jgi:zinc transport system substrate-binding protein